MGRRSSRSSELANMNYFTLRFMYNDQISEKINPFTAREDNICSICGGVATE